MIWGLLYEQMFGKNSVDYVRSKLENPYIEVEKAQNKYLTSDLLQKNFIFDQIIFPDGKKYIHTTSYYSGECFGTR